MRAPATTVTALALALVFAACGDDDPADKDTTPDATTQTDTAADTSAETSDDTATSAETNETSEDTADDADVTEPPGPEFAFGLELGQSIGDGPFPNDVLRDEDGLVSIASLKDDARWGTLAKADILDRTTQQIGRRRGFSFASSVYFPMTVEPDLASFEDKVHFVALTGPEAGAVFPAEVFWSPTAELLGAFPRWGHYLVPGATYGVIVDVGVTTKGGRTITAHPDWSAVIAAEAPANPPASVSRARTLYADLRAFLAVRDTAAVVGTVFTTEDAYAYLEALMDATRDYPLVTPTRRVRSTATDTLTWEEAIDVKGDAALLDYFGPAPTGAFAFTPGGWGGNRDAAKAFTDDGEPYDGGTFHGEVAYVVNGSIAAPSFNLRADEATGAVSSGPITFENDGTPKATATVLVPFSLYLCAAHVNGDALVTTPIPIAIFTHGGTALRSDALAFAVVNCREDRATIAMDLPFHGGRQAARWFADVGAIVPVQADAVNTFKPASAGGRTSDYIGDNGGATTTVGGFFALDKNLDPEVIEANHLAVAVETETLVRYLQEPGPTGLGAALGVSFDTSTLVHESLSFGTSFGTAFLAQSDDLAGAIVSVGSGQMLSINLPMAPNNANLASNLFVSVLGLRTSVPDMVQGAYRDPVVALTQWLAQRGDPIAYAPFVLRHRRAAEPFHVIGFGDSWDETLFTPAQITFANAWGLPVFTSAGWELDATTPGADTIDARAMPITPPAGNLTVGAETVSAGYFYYDAACHAEVVIPLCESGFEPPYPPPTARATPLVSRSPICAMQRVMAGFLADVTAGGPVAITAPTDPAAGDCADLYE